MSTATLDSSLLEKYRRYRFLKDRVTTVSVTIGGLSVVGTLLLIFLYLFSEVIPLLKGAEIHKINQYPLVKPEQTTLYTAMEEQAEVAVRITKQGNAIFWQTSDGALINEIALPIPENTAITAVGESSADNRILIVGLSNGEALIVKHHYLTSYPNEVRLITPLLEYPYGEDTITLGSNTAINQITMRDSEELMTIAALDNENQLSLVRFIKEEDFLSGEIVLEKENVDLGFSHTTINHLAIDSSQHWLFIVENNNQLTAIDLAQDSPVIVDTYSITDSANKFTDMTLLLGGISVLTADTQGNILQWFMVRGSNGAWSMQQIREFSATPANNTQLIVEQRRKGFLSYSNQGDDYSSDDDGQSELIIFHSTSHRELLRETLPTAIDHVAISPRANALIVIDNKNNVSFWTLENEHPDISWHALWDEIWYESYKKPDYIWQSSSASSDFEPKFSLTPLAFGTLKAAFYTLLFAAPLAICGAIYTAYFMTPVLRRKVKPLIELMEALPTVILGFLAGIWLAPFIENNLTGIFTLSISIPFTILLTGYLWYVAPKRLKYKIPDGWEAALLVPTILLTVWCSIHFAKVLELFLFDGDMRTWITHEMGISFDQRNALVVGIAMGLAVIPTIFSITEDAIFSVPKHLSNGSLALGASPWQTLVGVVLPTASPSIFSALMIGMGRAVGETMIVLMATGNTPIMDANIFEGMRTLSANIAVEVPEAEVDSTHFRILYLSAFFLFLFTFVVNTVAELVRQRLRKRYGSL